MGLLACFGNVVRWSLAGFMWLWVVSALCEYASTRFGPLVLMNGSRSTAGCSTGHSWVAWARSVYRVYEHDLPALHNLPLLYVQKV